MNQHLRLTYWVVLGITLSILLIGWLFPAVEQAVAVPLFVALMVITGLPHGATDHLIDKFELEEKGKTFAWGRFLAVYLGAMVLYALAWWIWPLLSLALFLLISAYHFGQSQLLYVKGGEKEPLKMLMYISWGLTVLIAIIGLHPLESGEILSALLPQHQWQLLNTLWLPLLIGSGTLTLGLLTFRLIRGQLTARAYAWEWINLGILLALSVSAGLLTSFAIYFGLWHSIASIRAEMGILQHKRPSFSLMDFVKAALPFSLISIFGVLLLIGLGWYAQAFISPYLLFFMAISVLTLPHMIFMQKFYALGGERIQG